MTQEQKLGILRELLVSAAAVLIAYGFGTDALYHELIGGILAGVSIFWGIRANAGWEAMASMVRKALSAAGAVLVFTGTLTPGNSELIMGLAMNIVAIIWSVFAKPGPPIEN
jgi:hypothetical protein